MNQLRDLESRPTGTADPMGDTHDRYRCIACAGDFIAKIHEWKTEQ